MGSAQLVDLSTGEQVCSPGRISCIGESCVSGGRGEAVGREGKWPRKPPYTDVQVTADERMSEDRNVTRPQKPKSVGEDDKHGHVLIVSYPVASYDFSNF